MPAAAINNRNPLINILHMGLLDRQIQPKTGRDGSLDYGLTGRDISALQRTCHAAHDTLQMTPEAQVNTLARLVQPWMSEPVRPEGLVQAKLFMTRIAERTTIKPRNVCYALGEMLSLGFEFVHSQTTPMERQAGIVFFGVMHAHSGPMTETGRISRWVLQMRGRPTQDFTQYVKASGASTFSDTARLAMMASLSVGSFAAIEVASRLTHSSHATVRRAANTTVFMWPALMALGVYSAVVTVPLLIGCICVASDTAKEAASFAQIEFYKDAILLDLLVWDRSPLLFDHDDRTHQALFPSRLPRKAQDVGTEKLISLKAFFGRHLAGA